MKNIKIKTSNPKAFEETMRPLAPCLVEQNPDGSYRPLQGHTNVYKCRILSNEDFAVFAIKNQGYAEIIEE